jgi:hypothetical protein
MGEKAITGLGSEDFPLELDHDGGIDRVKVSVVFM